MRAKLGPVLALVAALLLGAVPAGADHDGATVEWTRLLPARPDVGEATDPVRHCGRDGLRCLREVERRLARLAEDFGCDHRAVFATTYQLLTRELRLEVERRPQPFDDPAGVGLLATVFFDMYLDALAAHEAGEPVPPAWQVTLDAARDAEHNAGQDMVLAISAHVQRDMPFAVAAVGLRTPDGTSRKGDHDHVNRVLSRAYDEIVPTVAERYDPFMAVVDAKPSPADDIAASQLVASWREGVWRNAERLAAGQEPRELVAQSIEWHAEGWARSIAAPQTPGYREVRASYCEAARAG